MSSTISLPIYSTDSADFRQVARETTPTLPSTPGIAFIPAYEQFTIASGTLVDISYLHHPASRSPWSTPQNLIDRHVRTDELWVPVKGEFFTAMGVASHPNDPESRPVALEMKCFAIHEGQSFVVRPNVWHGPVWPMRPDQEVAFYMFLSGHRQDPGRRGTVDHISLELADGESIVPDVESWSRAEQS